MTERVDRDTGEIVQDGEAAVGTALARVEPSGELARRQSVAGMIRPVESPAVLLEVQEETRKLIAEVLVEGRDYGKIPGTDGNSLLQPGAQRIASAFGCSAETEIVEATVEHDRVVEWEKKRKIWKNRKFAGWERETGTSIGLYRYVARCRLRHRGSGVVIGEGLGICSSFEDRYVDRPRDLEHTIMRMAKKRALVDAVLQTFSLSEQFKAPEEAEEEREELPYEEQLKIARGRYHALLAEAEPLAQIREFQREAFQKVHKKLPDSSTEWELQHFQRAVNDLEKFGAKPTLEAAVQKRAEADPADAEVVDLLAQAIEGQELPPTLGEVVTWVRTAGVAAWVRQVAKEIGQLRGALQETPDPEELEQQAAEAREAERAEDDELPF